MYKKIDSLTDEQSEKAIEEPAKKFNIIYAHEATNKIVEITKGYPFFIQQLCKIATHLSIWPQTLQMIWNLCQPIQVQRDICGIGDQIKKNGNFLFSKVKRTTTF